MKTMKGNHTIIAICAVMVLVFFTTVASAEELKLGVIAVQTGPATQWGRATLRGAEMAAEDINNSGGLNVKGKKYTVKLLSYDDQGTGKGGVSAATRLIFEDKVKFIAGPNGTAAWMAAKEVTEQNKVIVLPASYSRRAIKDSKFAFRVYDTPEEFAPPFCKWLKDTYPTLKRVAIHAPNDETGWESQAEDIMGYEMNGFEIVFKEFYQRGTKDFFPLLTKMMAQNPDILELNGSAPGDCGLIVKQARQMGFKGLVVKVGGPVTEELVRIAGKENVEGGIVYVPFDPKEPRIDAFIKRYEAKYKDEMNYFLPCYYDMTKLLLNAIQNAGTVDDTEKVVKAMEEFDLTKWNNPSLFSPKFGGLAGPFGWTGKESYGVNHQAMMTIAVAKIIDGRGVVVTTLGRK